MSHHSHTIPATTESQHDEAKYSTESLRKRYLWQAVPARRPNAATCSPACRQRSAVSVARPNRRSANTTRSTSGWRRLFCTKKQMALAEAERQAAERERHAAARQAEEERRRSQPQPKPAPKPDDRRGWVGIGGLGPYEEPVQTITIPTKPSFHPHTNLERAAMICHSERRPPQYADIYKSD